VNITKKVEDLMARFQAEWLQRKQQDELTLAEQRAFIEQQTKLREAKLSELKSK